MLSMSLFDDAVHLADRVHAGELHDDRADYLKAMTRDAPTTEAYNFFLYHLVKRVQPTLVVETGTDRGRSGAHMAEGSNAVVVYSIDIDKVCSDQLAAFGLTNVNVITGSSLDPSILARFPDRSIDILFLDSLHTYEHLRAELAVYLPKVRSGGLAVLDDVSLDAGMKKAWAEISLRKLDTKLHFSGFGIVEVP
jgi:predicted O-methyltransferase YrrM